MTKPMDDDLQHRSDNDLAEKQALIDEKHAILALREGLDLLERHIPVSPPSQIWLLQQIEERKARNRKRLIRDLVLFVLIAVVILSMFISAIVRMPAVFLIMQLVSLVVAPLVLVSLPRKRVEP